MSWLMGVCIFGPFVMLCPCGACLSHAAEGTRNCLAGVQGLTCSPCVLSACSPPDGREVYLADEAYDEVKGVPEVSACRYNNTGAVGWQLYSLPLALAHTPPGTRG